MTLWFRRVRGLHTETMREIAETAGVEWDYQSITYQANGIGYANGDPDDQAALQTAAETVVGFQPEPYEPPTYDYDGEFEGF